MPTFEFQFLFWKKDFIYRKKKKKSFKLKTRMIKSYGRGKYATILNFNSKITRCLFEEHFAEKKISAVYAN